MKNLILLVLLFYFGFGLYLYLNQRNFIYFPISYVSTGMDEEVFHHQQQQIKVTVLNRGKKKAIMYFGGNAENVDYNATDFMTRFSNHTLYLVKYRGYGGSTGKPTEAALYADALHIYDELKPRYAEISLIGRSLGSAIATYLASKRQVHKLALVTPFDSAISIAQEQFPIYPMRLLLKDKYDSISRVNKISIPTLVLAAAQDRIIERHRTQKLVDAFSAPVTLKLIKNTGHNTISASPDYYRSLTSFLSN